MEMKEEIRIEAPVPVVFAALNDPGVLRQCIPGCEDLVEQADNVMEARVSLRIGPVKARFTGKVTLDTAGAPHRFSLAGEGSGGIAGFAKGGADVGLRPEGEATVLAYEARAEIGGKIAQLGSRLVDSTARKLSGQFFARFKDIVENDSAAQSG
ncbi:MAG: carbon monoxide dehydrogenase [Ahrensia sp.]|nr:carbon monoxide dehydrogenase [Ahrensia sp.]